ncbi:MAG: phosphodiester glycosidase family protein [Rhodobacteraceae bacterium]|nr:phosphodiester glycosidase family protein [Paracoccaceae bacterium]
MTHHWALAALLCLCATTTAAVTCRDIDFDKTPYTICEATAAEDIRLFLYNKNGMPLGHFGNVNAQLAATDETLVFGMNAGMYHDNRAPVGLYLDNGTWEMRLVTSAGPGNFGLVPNGVFCIRDTRSDVIETLRFTRETMPCTYATQSGPMLVIDGRLHPRFLPKSTSRYIRNGVGTSTDGQRLVFAISRGPVNFHSFGRLFRDYLKLPNALYFDGNISRLYAPDIGRSDPGVRMGPIVGIVAPQS